MTSLGPGAGFRFSRVISRGRGISSRVLASPTRPPTGPYSSVLTNAVAVTGFIGIGSIRQSFSSFFIFSRLYYYDRYYYGCSLGPGAFACHIYTLQKGTTAARTVHYGRSARGSKNRENRQTQRDALIFRNPGAHRKGHFSGLRSRRRRPEYVVVAE